MGIRHVFLTGQPGSGKTTLVRRIASENAQEDSTRLAGFYTSEVKKANERIGFDVVDVCDPDKKAILSRVASAAAGAGGAARPPKRAKRPAVGRYLVDVASFEAMAASCLREDRVSAAGLVVVDEVGKMELFSELFYPQVTALLEDGRAPVLGVIPSPRYGRTIPQVEAIRTREDVVVHKLTRSTRAEVYDAVRHDVLAAMAEASRARHGAQAS